jgi:hypothetical protein
LKNRVRWIALANGIAHFRHLTYFKLELDISGFGHGVFGAFALGCHAGYDDGWLLKFRENVSVPFSRVKQTRNSA